MMVTTHAFAGLLVAAPLAFLHPEYAAMVAAASISGGIFPDLDVAVGLHRKTLHYPVGYWLLAGVLGGGLLVAGSSTLLFAFAFILGAAVHSVSDVFGGGLEKRPWERTTDRAVFCHVLGRWLPPRHHVAYDGSPGDFVLTVGLAGAGFVLYTGVSFIEPLALLSTIIAGGYTVVRRRLPALEDWLYENVPFLHPFLEGLH